MLRTLSGIWMERKSTRTLVHFNMNLFHCTAVGLNSNYGCVFYCRRMCGVRVRVVMSSGRTRGRGDGDGGGRSGSGGRDRGGPRGGGGRGYDRR